MSLAIGDFLFCSQTMQHSTWSSPLASTGITSPPTAAAAALAATAQQQQQQQQQLPQHKHACAAMRHRDRTEYILYLTTTAAARPGSGPDL